MNREQRRKVGGKQKSLQWCDKHWAAVRDGDYNGILASMHLMQVFIESDMVNELTDHSATAMNKALESVAPLCCWIGEEKLKEIMAKSKREAEHG